MLDFTYLFIYLFLRVLLRVCLGLIKDVVSLTLYIISEVLAATMTSSSSSSMVNPLLPTGGRGLQKPLSIFQKYFCAYRIMLIALMYSYTDDKHTFLKTTSFQHIIIN